jgi:hypothetical protein
VLTLEMQPNGAVAVGGQNSARATADRARTRFLLHAPLLKWNNGTNGGSAGVSLILQPEQHFGLFRLPILAFARFSGVCSGVPFVDPLGREIARPSVLKLAAVVAARGFVSDPKFLRRDPQGLPAEQAGERVLGDGLPEWPYSAQGRPSISPKRSARSAEATRSSPLGGLPRSAAS